VAPVPPHEGSVFKETSVWRAIPFMQREVSYYAAAVDRGGGRPAQQGRTLGAAARQAQARRKPYRRCAA